MMKTVTQSALSQQLNKIYAQGIPPLFYYENRKMLLTDAGKIYVNGARAILRMKTRSMNEIPKMVEV